MLDVIKKLVMTVPAMVLAGVVLLAPSSFAGEIQMMGDSEAKAIFNAADKNSDGQLTKSELTNFIINKIKEAVGDSITEKELKKLIALVPAKVDGYFDTADKDGNDQLSFKEFKEVAGELT